MAEQNSNPEQISDEEDVSSSNYKAPAKKTLQEIHELDKEDESLQKYKQMLLGTASASADPNAKNVEVISMSLVSEHAPHEMILDLKGNLDDLKKNPFVLKEGVEYKIKICFKVNKDIVAGLKYFQQTFRKGLKVDKANYMVGSYGPRGEAYEYLTTVEEAPKGLISRGTYLIKSKFTDDDKHDHLSWEWNLEIRKDW